MFIAWGEKFYGYVCYIDGICYICTRFFYFQFLPMIPLQSYIVIAGTEEDDGFKGVPIPMSGKSVLAGYLRAPVALASMVCFVLFALAAGRCVDMSDLGLGCAILFPLMCLAGTVLWNRFGNFVSIALVVMAVGLLAYCFTAKVPNKPLPLMDAVFALGTFGVYHLTRLFNRPSLAQAEEMLEKLGLDRRQAMALLNQPGRD